MTKYEFDEDLIGGFTMDKDGEALFCPEHGTFYDNTPSNSPMWLSRLLDELADHVAKEHT